MAVHREAPKCPICGQPYEAITRHQSSNFVGDAFVMWDTERHVCKPDHGHVLSRYEQRLERIVDTIRAISTVEAIVFLKKHIAPLSNEED